MADHAFVIGDPIAHSRSPLIHGYWLREHGIAGSYQAIHVKQAGLADFVKTFAKQGYIGGNVTVPHKEAVFELVAQRDEAAEEIGAVNTLWLEEGTLAGGNTDSYGFAQNLDDNAPGWDKAGAALVIGAGGASRGVIHALKLRGFSDIRVANRSLDRAKALADAFGPKVTAHRLEALGELASGAGLVVNTSSLGMDGVGDISLDMDLLAENALVTDIVYIPLETPFLALARRAGRKTVDGLGMLLHQARPGFEKWFGAMPRVTPQLRQLVIADMDHSA